MGADHTTLLVLDLQALAFLDLAGLTAILRADEYCKNQQIRLTVMKPRGFAGRVFALTGVQRDLELVNPPAPGWSRPRLGRDLRSSARPSRS